VPIFVLMSRLNLINTFPALILPFAAGPFGVFLMRQLIRQIPNELLDAVFLVLQRFFTRGIARTGLKG
jgi:multiple sugar transport system permease protein